ncbi:MAG: hypothetical protein J5545_04615 [Bacteroidaceae bacterium]|nr:hypothetical protein [Bacteroidaceae bacterium]
MKKILTLILFASMMMATNGAFAQNTLVAALEHEGSFTYFYGINALVQAHEAAAHGDVITLSEGTFNPLTITKAVSIYGAGMEFSNVSAVTSFSGDLTINITEEVNTPLIMQGIYTNHTITVTTAPKNSSISKSRIGEIDINDEMTFVHCRILQSSGNGLKCMYNCFLRCVQSVNTYNFMCNNCVIDLYDSPTQIQNSSFYNCIISARASATSLPNSNIVFNSLGIGNNVFYSVSGNNNATGNSEDIFKTYINTYTDEETFELTDEAKTTYKGTDGTEVGLYGGSFPYDPTPSLPLITSYQVANKAVNGKVSVNIKINGATE